jgi:hypothetical protein
MQAANPTFTWMINGNPVPGNGTVFTTNNLADADIVSCLMNADANSKCVSQSSAISNSISMQVSQVTSPTVTIKESANDICPGKTGIFFGYRK